MTLNLLDSPNRTIHLLVSPFPNIPEITTRMTQRQLNDYISNMKISDMISLLCNFTGEFQYDPNNPYKLLKKQDIVV